MNGYLKLLRVRHYIKNLLVIFPILCSGQLFNGGVYAFVGFALFSLMASIVYIINDIRDREKDRNHPTKCRRPIASGEITVAHAGVLVIILLFLVVVGNWFYFSFSALMILGAYLLTNLAYSFGLKNYPIIDVAILAAGFGLRVLYGAVITDIEISSWLYLTVITLAFYLALGKRRNELKLIGSGETRRVLQSYTVGFLDKNMWMYLALANVFYALWSMDTNTISLYGNEHLVLTVPLVFLITMKYSLNIEQNSDGDPVEVLLRDHFLVILCMVYFAIMFGILYW